MFADKYASRTWATLCRVPLFCAALIRGRALLGNAVRAD